MNTAVAPKLTAQAVELLRLWIEALRSGLYPQAVMVLKTKLVDNTIAYCCWGVLCEINGVSWHFVYDRHYSPIGAADRMNGHMCLSPEYLRKTLFESFSDEQIREIHDKYETMNDIDKSFAEIADELEREFLQGEVQG